MFSGYIINQCILIQDSQIVVDCFKSGFEPPVDYPFEDYSLHIYRTVSDGTISTPKQEVMRNDPKITMGKAKGKLWLFGKKPKVRIEQPCLLCSIFNLGSSFKRKLLEYV